MLLGKKKKKSHSLLRKWCENRKVKKNWKKKSGIKKKRKDEKSVKIAYLSSANPDAYLPAEAGLQLRGDTD